MSIYKHCYKCDCYDPDTGCTMPSSDKWYACPVESKLPENQAALDRMIEDTMKEREEVEEDEG